MIVPEELLARAGQGAAEVLSRNLGTPITPDLMLDVRESPTGLCRLVLEVLGLAPGIEMVVPTDLGAWGLANPALGVRHEPDLRRVPTWRLRAIEDLDETPPGSAT